MSLPRAYEDPHEPGALGVVEPFAKAHKLKTPEAQQIIQSVLSYTLHKPRRTRFPTTPTLIFDQDERWQMDLVDMQKLRRWNKGHKCLLTLIDVLSKYAWAVPIRSKSSKEVIRGLAGIYKQASPRRPLREQTDQGKEFYNAGVQAWLKQQATHHFSTFGDSKASVVERWHRTLKQRCTATLQPRFRVEKVLKRKGHNVLVRWKGWPSKYDSWIPAHGAKKTKNAP